MRHISDTTLIIAYNTVRVLGQMCAAAYLVVSCGRLLSVKTAKPATRRIGAYLFLSAMFIAVDLFSSMLAAVGYYTAHTPVGRKAVTEHGVVHVHFSRTVYT